MVATDAAAAVAGEAVVIVVVIGIVVMTMPVVLMLVMITVMITTTVTTTAAAKVAGIAIRQDERALSLSWKRLTVSGPQEPLHDFLSAWSGAGFIDWRPEWHNVYEQMYLTTAQSAPTRSAAENLARSIG